MTAATVCVVCSAVYPIRDPHTCTYENPHQEGTPMQHPTRAGLKLPAAADELVFVGNEPSLTLNEPAVRLECLRLATETGIAIDHIQTRAAEWADFVLGTNQKEN